MPRTTHKRCRHCKHLKDRRLFTTPTAPSCTACMAALRTGYEAMQQDDTPEPTGHSNIPASMQLTPAQAHWERLKGLLPPALYAAEQAAYQRDVRAEQRARRLGDHAMRQVSGYRTIRATRPATLAGLLEATDPADARNGGDASSGQDDTPLTC